MRRFREKCLSDMMHCSKEEQAVVRWPNRKRMASPPTEPRRPLPLIVPAPVEGLDLAVWAADRGQWIEDALED
jgi:hypothetical protein